LRILHPVEFVDEPVMSRKGSDSDSICL